MRARLLVSVRFGFTSLVTAATLIAALAIAPGCASNPPPVAQAGSASTGAGAPKIATPPADAGDQAGNDNVEMSPDASPKAAVVAWTDLNDATFARAKAEGKLVLLDGAAEWCHWCHVMDATTYHDPAIVKLLADHFIAAKVDIDERPDVETRFGAYGWPATVVFRADGSQLGAYKGYVPPDDFLEKLQGLLASAANQVDAKEAAKPKVESTPLPDEELAWITRDVAGELDEYRDKKAGSWGRGQKVALYTDNAWCLTRGEHGDQDRLDEGLAAMRIQRPLIDPVWGGVYQYSTDGDWVHPHFEKLMTFNAGLLSNDAQAYGITHADEWKDEAAKERGYLDQFLRGADGGFYATQDADFGAHDPNGHFMSGHEYYAKNDADRRKVGIPRIDTHEYARENGLAIAAYADLFVATNDATAKDEAAKAATLIFATHALRGGVSHDVSPHESTLLFLADNATFGFALVRMYEATHDEQWLVKAKSVAKAMQAELEDKAGGGFFASSKDDRAVGVFSDRQTPFGDNVTALRFFIHLERASRDASYRPTINRTVRAIVTPEQIHASGRMLGDVLQALDEVATLSPSHAAASKGAAPSKGHSVLDVTIK